MEGDMVVVRAFGGEPKISRVWKIGNGFIFVCSEANYQTLRSGKRGLWPVGIPNEDVFQYNPKHDNILKNWRNDPHLWEHLANYV